MSDNNQVNHFDGKQTIDEEHFFKTVIGLYNDGSGPEVLPADFWTARSIVPPGTGVERDFSYISPDIPEFYADKCIGCMECVTMCPDTAILGKVVAKSVLEKSIDELPEEEKVVIRKHFSVTKKYWDVPQKKGFEPGYFAIWVDPSKCKGCGECVDVCGEHHALAMITKDQKIMNDYKKIHLFIRNKLPETPKEYINEKTLADFMLTDRALGYVGGAGSCAGCGEATAIRMLISATHFVYGENSMAIAASTGCNTVYGSTYPFNPYKVTWINSLFENSTVVAVGMKAMYDKLGFGNVKVWALGGDGAMADIGFQPLSRVLVSGMDIKIMVLDTQVYSNTGGQASTTTFTGQDAKMSAFGKVKKGKAERRKELGLIAMMHPEVYVAQTTPAHITHFYRAVMGANEYPGPAIVIAYSVCQPEHGVGDDASTRQAKLAVDSRAFPLFIYDPRKSHSIKERLSLHGNPSIDKDWSVDHSGKEIKFVDWAKTEGRFSKHFKNGNPSEELLAIQEERLKNWRTLKELAGLLK